MQVSIEDFYHALEYLENHKVSLSDKCFKFRGMKAPAQVCCLMSGKLVYHVADELAWQLKLTSLDQQQGTQTSKLARHDSDSYKREVQKKWDNAVRVQQKRFSNISAALDEDL